ncbi:hypothetical protein E1211_17815 [Micromonospora sp. 15K316]|uniref:hypothetical protein n=1 Tax=Micromonospora sp. 15K316 TaxID=2530376 RepID=UPI0010486227|nr:hypothetical protein [Micromonospora sp. 15K316]TDC34205.1 hypothetical protein E1211_17815 [Micromonospora sp. 15K316]
MTDLVVVPQPGDPHARPDTDADTERICGHCRTPMRGYARLGDIWLCHPDDGLDCYRMVTLYGHGAPCFPCASIHYQGADRD